MTSVTVTGGTGRPPKKVDWDFVEKRLEAGSSGLSISKEIGIYPDIFYDKVLAHYGEPLTVIAAKFKSKGDESLRRAQYEKAIGINKRGDTTLLTFLGKVRLKQRETDSEEDKTKEMNPHLDMLHQLLEENKLLKEKLNAPQPQTTVELPTGDTQIQHMGGSCEIRQDILEHPEADPSSETWPPGGCDDNRSEPLNDPPECLDEALRNPGVPLSLPDGDEGPSLWP